MIPLFVVTRAITLISVAPFSLPLPQPRDRHHLKPRRPTEFQVGGQKQEDINTKQIALVV